MDDYQKLLSEKIADLDVFEARALADGDAYGVTTALDRKWGLYEALFAYSKIKNQLNEKL